MPAAAWDLTTLAQLTALVKPVTAGDEGTSGIMQQLITGLSRYVIQSVLNRRNVNVSVQLVDTMDGSGSDKMMLKDWPVTAVASVVVFGQTVPQSPDGVTPGWVFDDYSIILLPNTAIGSPLSNWPFILGRFPRARLNVKVTYTAGYTSGTNPPADSNYNGAPSDLGAAVTFLVAQEYKRKDWIDQASKTFGTGETVSFQRREWPEWVNRVMEGYRRHFYV